MSSAAAKPLRWNVDWNSLKPMQRFLIWFPILGPQRRIYADLLHQLEARSPQEYQSWEKLGKEIQAAASSVAKILIDYLGWPKTATFLPQDPADIPFWDRRGDLATVEAIMAVEKHLGVTMPKNFWLSLPKISFGVAITELVEAQKAKQASSASGTS